MQPTGHAKLLARGDFAFDIELRRGVFPDKNSGKAGPDSLRVKTGDFGFQLGENFVADFQAVEDACRHTERIAQRYGGIIHPRTSRTIRIMAARLRSTSSGVVAQLETLIRMAVLPCHTVPPHQHTPSC